LGQDGIVNGAVYGLMALALVLVFSVTRVIFIPQGEFVAFGALSMAMLQAGRVPATLWLLLALAAMVLVVEFWRWKRGAVVDWASALAWCVVLPLAAAALVLLLKPTSMAGQTLTTLLLIMPLGPLLYRLAYRPLADANVLMLLIVSVALHGVLVGLGLLFFGAEGSRTRPSRTRASTSAASRSAGRSLVVVGVTLLLVIAMFLFFGARWSARRCAPPPSTASAHGSRAFPPSCSGDLSFALAALIGAVSGLLIAPITTVYYDTGFLIGLKGFVAAIVGGLASYPLALVGALLVGQLEAFASFWASPFKEVLVFTLIIPVLWWRSLRSHHVEDEE
jgi:branched-chain amino acid transport system permease protein